MLPFQKNKGILQSSKKTRTFAMFQRTAQAMFFGAFQIFSFNTQMIGDRPTACARHKIKKRKLAGIDP